MSKLITKIKNKFKKREKTREEIIFELIQDFYLKEDNRKINKLAKKISIVNIVEKNVEYITAEGYYESRKIYNTREPSKYIKLDSNKKVSADSYDKWNFKLQSYAKEFVNENNTYTLDESKYIEGCVKCGTKGRYECKACVTGYLDCRVCDASGYMKCDNCYGSGKTTCTSCGGSGREIGYEYIYHPDGREERIRVTESCYSCYGSGKVDCQYCGGWGKFDCDNCNGSGYIPCATCLGTKIAFCTGCNGEGYYLNQVKVEQKYAIEKFLTVMKGYDIDPNKYGTQTFSKLVLSENDVCTEERVLDSTIEPKERTILDSMKKAIIKAVNEKGGKSVIKYRLRGYKREVVEVEYTVKGKTFNSMIDLSTREVITDKNPYDVFKIKVKAPKVKKNDSKKQKQKQKRKVKIYIKDILDFLVVLLIGITIIGVINYGLIIEFIKEKAWICTTINAISMLFPISKWYTMWQDLDLGILRIFGYIKMVFVVLFVTMIAYTCVVVLSSIIYSVNGLYL